MSARARFTLALVAFAAVASGCGSTDPAANPRTPAANPPAPGTHPPATAANPSAGSPAAGAPSPAGPPDGPVPRGFRAQSVTFISPSTGWVLGTAPCASPPCTSVLRTRDGGRTWHGIPAPRAKLVRFAPGVGVTELRFADALNGWAFGPELWATHDGGSHWRRVRLATGVQSLAAAAGHALAVLGSRTRIRVLRAAVAADAWTRVASFAQSGFIGTPDLAVSGASAWISGAAGLYVSTDGVLWRTLPRPCPASTRDPFSSAWLTSPSDGVVVCGGQGAAGSAEKAVYGSIDGGRSFRLLGRPPRGGDLQSVAANRLNTVIVAAASGASELYGSFDGGRSYRAVLTLANGGRGWRDLGFTSDEQGVVVESGGDPGRLWLTRDGGRHWQAVRFAGG